jgi:ribosomal protein S12 methylthiotransferase
VGTTVEVLVDGNDSDHGGLVGRTHREAPEIDGVVHVAGDAFACPGALVTATVTGATGPDLHAAADRAAVAS